MKDQLSQTVKPDASFGYFAVFFVAALGVSLSVLEASGPVLTLALCLAGGLAVLFLKSPCLALNVVLFMGGIPLEALGGHDLDSGQKPLLRFSGGTTVDGICLVTLCFVMTFLLLSSGPVRVPERFRPYVFFLGFLGFSLVYSGARLEGLRLLFKLAYAVLIFLVTSRSVKTPREVTSAVGCWVAGGIVATLLGGLTYLFRGPAAFITSEDFRYSSGLLHQSPFSMYMFALFALCYSIWRTRGARGYAALALLFGLQAMIAETRITWAAVAVSLLIFESTMGKGRRIVRAAGLAGGMVTILLYMVWHSTGLQYRFFSMQFDPQSSAGELIQNLNVSGRNFVWAGVYENFLSHSLWFGQGVGSSGAFLAAYLPDQAVPHNEYLRVLHDGGVIGTVLFLTGLVGLFGLLRSLLVNCIAVEQRMFVRLSLMLFFGYLVMAMTDNPFDYYLVFTQYVFFAMAV